MFKENSKITNIMCKQMDNTFSSWQFTDENDELSNMP